MDTKEITIAVDAMGGDNAPGAIVRGAVEAHRELGANVILVGAEAEIRKELIELDAADMTVVDASQAVTMDDAPTVVLRKKPDSSIMKAFKLAKEKIAHGVVSAGNSGATMASAVLTLGKFPGVDRPAIAGTLPSVHGSTLVIDIGANVNCKPHQLLQFALMGDVYLRHIVGLRNPRVGLLSIGEEDSKGNELIKMVHGRLRESSMNFIGNVEGRDVFSGVVDLVVCDGFVGNVLLKVSEGLGGVVFSILEQEVVKDKAAQEGLNLMREAFQSARRRVDYEEVGGAPLLGINGVGIICHGSSGPKAIKNAVRVAQEMVINRVEHFMGQEFNEHAELKKSVA